MSVVEIGTGEVEIDNDDGSDNGNGSEGVDEVDDRSEDRDDGDDGVVEGGNAGETLEEV